MKKMKNTLFNSVTLLLMGILAVSPVLAGNPLVWTKYTADPNPIVWNDRVYVYASNDDNNPTTGGYDIKAYTLMSSDDMANWTDHGEVFRVPRDMSMNNQAYAPGAAVKNGIVYLYVPDGGSKISVARAVRPEGPFTDAKSLITKSDANNTNVPWLFDPAAFIDTDGQAYIYFGGGDQGGNNLRGAKLNSDMMSWQTPATTILNTRCSFEAAYVHKRGNTYYFSYSTNFSCNDNTAGNGNFAYMTSDNPLTGWTYRGILLGGVAGNNHTSTLEYKGNWYLFYHDRRLRDNSSVRPSWIPTEGDRRSVGVDIMEYNADGTIKQVTRTAGGPPQIKNLNPYDTIRAVTINAMSGAGLRTSASTGGCGNEGGTGKEGKQILTHISNDKWIRVKGVDFGSGATKVKVRAAAATGSSGRIEFRTGSQTGTLIGTCNITSTGSWTTWNTFECDISNASGVKDFLYLVFKGTASELFRLDWYKFEGAEVACEKPAPVPTPNNLVSDGIFSGTTLSSSWSLTNVSGGAEASASVECNKAKITITKVGTEIYQPQLIQQGITLEEGKSYELSFKASAAANRTIEVKLERIGGDGIEWGHTYGDAKTFNLTSTEGTYTLKLDMTDPTDKNVQLAFNLGGVARDVTISDVKLLYTQDIPFVCKEPELTLTPNNLVSDGVFSGTELSSSWSLANVSGGAEASAIVECNKAKIAIAKVGTEIYQPQLIQQGITLEEGKSYELSFKASAAADRIITVQLERTGGEGIEWGYTYGDAQTFNLTSTEKTYTLKLDMTDPTDKNVQLAFNLGGEAKNVTISDVVLVSMETTSIKQNVPDKLPFVTINGRTLSLSTSNSVKVDIFDIHGKIVAKFSATGNSTFSLNDIPTGIYFVDIKGQDVESTTKIVLK